LNRLSGDGPAGPWLAVDTATDHVAVALWTPSGVLGEIVEPSRREHTRLLATAVERLLRGAGAAAEDLAGAVVAQGPGSYTGLRVGMAFVKGLAAASRFPVVGVPTCDSLAASLAASGPDGPPRLWCVLRAGRGRILAAPYGPGGKPEVEPASLSPAQPSALVDRVHGGEWIAGELDSDARRLFQEAGLRVIGPAASLRRPSWLAEVGAARAPHASVAPDDLSSLLPIYPASSGPTVS
jgi:tRNA threonylcarbamoyladenosine biosynthesis protein TsaB